MSTETPPLESPRALDRALECLGGVTALATALNVKSPTVTQWKTKGRPIPLERAMEIERLTNGKVTREALRPDVDWRRWRDLVVTSEETKEAA